MRKIHRAKSASVRDPRAMAKVALGGLLRFAAAEIRDEGVSAFAGTVSASLRNSSLTFVPARSLGEELDVRATRHPNDNFLTFEGERLSYAQLNENAARVAQYLDTHSVGLGKSVGLFLPNVPTFLEIFFATQRVGATAVPINTGLKAAGLSFIIDNAEITTLFTVKRLLPQLKTIPRDLRERIQVIVVPEHRGEESEAGRGSDVVAYAKVVASAPQPAPFRGIPSDAISLLLYTSGTTGHPKGVVYSYGGSQMKVLRAAAHFTLKKNDVYYTCLPLFHANALLVTCVAALYVGAEVALFRRFSASNFWREIRESRATVFNTIGTMIPILMKQPYDAQAAEHQIRTVISAACPAELWKDFEERFNLQVTESYGAVDGGGFMTINAGNAPVGSIGKPLGRKKFRLIDAQGDDVPIGEPGELVHYVGKPTRRDAGDVRYHKNEEATAEKTHDGWVHTGDLMRSDDAGFLYFVGRATDSMRVGGENVSAFEVENVVDRHEDVLESAAVGVPSELAEDEILLVVQPKDGRTIDPARLHSYAGKQLPKYAVPKFIRVVDQLPKTGTHRTMKHELKSAGVTASTWTAPTRGGA
jgi:carnitine-CoA ligase